MLKVPYWCFHWTDMRIVAVGTPEVRSELTSSGGNGFQFGDD